MDSKKTYDELEMEVSEYETVDTLGTSPTCTGCNDSAAGNS